MKNVRKMLIAVLDDEQGVNEQAYIHIAKICKINKWSDITDAVDATEGRYYLPEGHGLK